MWLLSAALLVAAGIAHAVLAQGAPSVCGDYTLVVYGSMPAGVAAAIHAARQNASAKVLILEPSEYIGGMMSPGGIGLRDHRNEKFMNSTEREWGLMNAQHYGVSYPVWQPDSYVGEDNLYKLIALQSNIDVVINHQVLEQDGVQVKGGIITQISTEKATQAPRRAPRPGALSVPDACVWTARYFIDASYEGDVAASAGVTVTFGREARSKYNESYGGVTGSSIAAFKVDVDATWDNGTLLPLVSDGPDPRKHLGEADYNLMAYSFRACVTTNASNKVPFPRPDGYDPARYELARRHVAAELRAKRSLSKPWGDLAYSSFPRSKLDACCGSAPIGIDATGLEVGYANGTRATRARIYETIREYVRGLMYFWSYDETSGIPDSDRAHYKDLGLCKDQWPENDHMPPQLYVREAYRIVGDSVFSQNDRVSADKLCRNDSIALGEWGVDIHEMQRVAVPPPPAPQSLMAASKIAFNEGLTSPGTGGSFTYELPYSILLPKRTEVTNLLVPNCPSVSHVTFAGIRVEPTLWRMGQAAGAAITQATRVSAGHVPLQDIEPAAIQAQLRAVGVPYHWPARPTCSSPVPPPPPPPPPPSPPQCKTYTVSGAGTAFVNGDYTFDSFVDNRPHFKHSSDSSLYAYGEQWHIAHEGVKIYYYATSSANLPPLTGWVTTDGQDPAPTLTQKDC